MPKQNRVTPFGVLIATEFRGTLMGNRGCLHDAQQHICRAFVGKRWIVCVLEFRGRHRAVMTPNHYTELFFLDEATAFAAGHRPCAECQRERYRLFREHWEAANPGLIRSSSSSIDEIDRILHAERLDETGRKRAYRAPVTELPSGAMVADDEGLPYLVQHDVLTRWEPGGYRESIVKPVDAVFNVLTPRSVVRAIAHGYPVMVHQSAEGGVPSRKATPPE